MRRPLKFSTEKELRMSTASRCESATRPNKEAATGTAAARTMTRQKIRGEGARESENHTVRENRKRKRRETEKQEKKKEGNRKTGKEKGG